MTIATLGIKVDPRQAIQGSNRAKRAIAGIGAGAGRVKSAIFSLQGALIALGGYKVISGIKNLDDTWIGLNNKIRIANQGLESNAKTMARLQGVSFRTGAKLQTTATIFSRLALATVGTSHTLEDMVRVTETLNKQVLIGGNNAQEASAGLIQFAQGVASGKLAGDELKSVMENLLGVQRGLIEGFGILQREGVIDFKVTKKNIRDLASTGVLSADLLVKALLAISPATDETFKQVEFTMSNVFSRISNQILQFVGDNKEITLVMSTIKKNITSLAKDLPDLLEKNDKAIAQTLKGIIKGLAMIADGVRTVWRLAAQAVNAISAMYQTTNKVLSDITNDIKLTRSTKILRQLKGELKEIQAMKPSEGFLGFGAQTQKDIDNLEKLKKKAIDNQQATVKRLAGEQLATASIGFEFDDMEGLTFFQDLVGDLLSDIDAEAEVKVKANTAPVKKLKNEILDTTNKTNALTESLGSVAKGFEGYFNKFGAAEEQTKSFEEVGRKTADGLADAFANMAVGIETDFKSMGRSILQMMLKIQMQKAIMDAMSSSSSSGGWASIIGSMFTSSSSSSSSPAYGTSDPNAFSFAGGGFTGSGARAGGIDGQGGFPAILHPNETVIDHNKGQGQGTVVNVSYSPQINTPDPESAQQYLMENAPTIVGVIRNAFNRAGEQVAI